MLMLMVLSATLGLGLGGLIRTVVNHWSSYVIAVVLGPVFGVLLAMGVSLLESGDKDRVLEMGQELWLGLLFTLIGVKMFTPNRHWVERPYPENLGKKFDPWQSGA